MLPMHSLLSRVVPATGETIAPPDLFDGLRYPILPTDRPFFLSLPSRYARLDSLHIRRLNSVDLPAFGGPMIETTSSALAFVLIYLGTIGKADGENDDDDGDVAGTGIAGDNDNDDDADDQQPDDRTRCRWLQTEMKSELR